MMTSSNNPSPSSKRVLIVEDEPLIAYDLKTEIENGSHRVVGQCGTASAAVEMTKDLRPDLVVMDIGLTGHGTGIDAAREIRRQFDIGCIFVSATLDKVDPDLWNEIRPIALIQKPFRDEALARAISREATEWEPITSKIRTARAPLKQPESTNHRGKPDLVETKTILKNMSNKTSN